MDMNWRKKMSKLPKIAKITFFILLMGLLFFILTLLRTVFVAEIGNEYVLTFSELQYFVVFGFVTIISFFVGIVFIYNFKTWTTEDFIERQDNPVTINKLLLGLYERKCDLIIKTPELKKIPDSVKIIITEHDINDMIKKPSKIKMVK